MEPGHVQAVPVAPDGVICRETDDDSRNGQEPADAQPDTESDDNPHEESGYGYGV